MPCNTRLREGQTLQDRVKAIDVALKRLETYLTQGKVTIGIAPNGAITFKGWNVGERDDVSDVCALRTLQAANSWPLRQAIARAEALTGRKVNTRAVEAGIHSHDGGKTWHPGHK